MRKIWLLVCLFCLFTIPCFAGFAVKQTQLQTKLYDVKQNILNKCVFNGVEHNRTYIVYGKIPNKDVWIVDWVRTNNIAAASLFLDKFEWTMKKAFGGVEKYNDMWVPCKPDSIFSK